MPTVNGTNSALAVGLVAQHFTCPHCGSTTAPGTSSSPATVTCSDCGAVGQVRSMKNTSRNAAWFDKPQQRVRGAAWSKIADAIANHNFRDLYLVKWNPTLAHAAIWCLARTHHTQQMYVPATPLKDSALRHGWEGYDIHIDRAEQEPTLVWSGAI